MKFILTWNAFPRMTATLWAVMLLCVIQANAQTGLYIHFPNDVSAATCDHSDTTGWGQPIVLALSNELVSVAYSDQVFLSLPDTCFKVLRTWSVVDWNTYNPVLPLVVIPNPPGLPGPTVAASGAAAPWTPSQMGGLNYAGFWSATANGYQYVQIISRAEATAPSGWYVDFPDDVIAPTCDYTDTSGWGQPATLALSNELLSATYSDQVFLSLPDTCFKVERTWSVIDWNNFNSALPLTKIPNPAGLSGPTVAAAGAAAPWTPSQMGGLNYASFWSATTNGYQYVQIISRAEATAPSGWYVDFPDDVIAPTCDYTDTSGWGQPTTLALSNELLSATYSDQVFLSLPDTCFKIERTWNVIDWNNFNPALPLTKISNPAGLSGPTVSAAGAAAPWTPSQMGGINYASFWSLNTNGYQYEQIITFITISSLSGYIKLDADNNCVSDPSQAGLPGMIVKMVDSNGDTLYASSALQGFYRFPDPAVGASMVEVVPPLPLWDICNNPVTLNIPGSTQVLHDFNAHPATECPILTVDLGTDLLRPCYTSNWYVSYCNIGGGEAQNAYVQITAAQPLILVGASQPFVLNGEVMTVQVGDVAVGDCGNFSITVETPCDSSIIGDQLCIEAHIFPDSFCVPPMAQWSGAQIEASAVCDGDSVRFTLLNTGTAPTVKALDYVIIDDMVVMHTGQLPIGFAPGATAAKVVVAQGHALRLRAEQEPGHPSAQSPSVAVEDCNGATVPSLLLEFTNEDGSPFTDMECREVVASFDPNEKLAFPTGFSSQHLIEANTRLTYQINFQNMGTDTAFLVVLRDTLSSLLDPASLRMGAGSHPYQWTLSGKGNLEIRFEDIQLPNLAVNEPASHGFVQFSIGQKADNAIGSLIENRAGIYFDVVNPVVQTNTVWHTVGKDFVGISGTNDLEKANALHIFPNPAVESAFLTLEGEKTVQVRMLDVFGRTVRNSSGTAPGVSLQRNGLVAGVYFVEVSDGKSWRQLGKMVWK